MYLIWQALANSVDPDETPQTRRLIRVYTVCHSSSYFLDTILDSKLYLFKFQIKYGKELRCLNTKGKYGKLETQKLN